MKRMTPARAFLALLLATATAALAQSGFPSRPVTLTVGYPPGGGPDATARVVAKKLSENIGVPVVVENRPGAGGGLSAQHAAAAAPDGYLIHLGAVGALAIAPVMSTAPYDVKKDFAPLTMAVNLPNLWVAPNNFPAKTMKDFVALARQKPGQLTYGSTGVATSGHLAGELLKQRADVDILHIPYKGAAPAMTDVIAGHVSAVCATIAAAKPHVEAGKLTPLATTGSARSPLMPGVPTVAESGLPDYEVNVWYVFVAPARTPREILEYWNRELVKVLRDPGVIADLAKQGMEVTPTTREEAARYMTAELDKWGKVVRDGKIKAE
jgi:tripartite-type tricarboxylate transporter receptor subunit TctC